MINADTVIALPGMIKAVACGNYNSCAVSEERAVYTWGEGRYGRLGLGGSVAVDTPRLVLKLGLTRVAQLACGGACTAALDENGVLHTWGSSTWNQCLHPDCHGGEARLTPRFARTHAHTSRREGKGQQCKG